MSQLALLANAAPVRIDQAYLLQARQMQALSFAVHIPLVCFGIAFPAMVLFVEWLYLRTGDELYRTLARRWTRVMAALFAVGVITGTILSFEMGLLWPSFTATFGSVFGLGFAIEGFSFFIEAIFIGIYVYGWDRLSPRAHFASGIPIVIAGFTGSLMVIAVNGWMNHPTGFRLVGGKVGRRAPAARRCSATATSGTSSCTCTWPATWSPASSSPAPTRSARLRGRWGRYERTALAIPLAVAALASPVQVLVGDWSGARGRGRASRSSSPRSRGCAHDDERRAGAHARLVHRRPGQVRDRRSRKLLSLLAFHDPNATVQGLDAVPADDRPPVNVVRVAFQTMVGIGTLLGAARRRLPGRARPAEAAARVALVLPRARRSPGRSSLVALIAGWVDDRGRAPAVGRLPGDAHLRGGHRRGRHPGRLRDARARLPRARGRGRLDPAPARRASRSPERAAAADVHLYELPLLFALVGLALYAVLARRRLRRRLVAADRRARTAGAAIRDHAHHAMAPVWEANHVWLIFVLTVVWTAYPSAFGSIASTLSIPLFIAAVGIIFRGDRLRAAGRRADARASCAAIDTAFSLSSILTPFALGAAVGGIASRPRAGRERRRRPVLELAQPDLDL